MKRSRTGAAILVIVLLAAGVMVISSIVSLVSDTEQESSSWRDMFLERGNKIGVVTLKGTLLTCDETLKQLKKFRKKSSVKAIVIRINSPGGTVGPAQEIYREIEKTKKKKPVVASMETIGTSAAYYVASPTDRIVCSRGTITGSIGVIMMMADVHKLIDKIGVGVNIIKAGKYKDIGSGVRPLTDEERKILETFAAEIHEQFITDVAKGRTGKITLEQVKDIADGRFFTGEKAKDMGLVDTIGNFYDAVRIAAELGGVKTEPELVYPEKKWEDVLDVFLESVSSAILTRVPQHTRFEPAAPAIR
ncbi:MAG: signal peptide peptidase SppA [Desulfomonile tiedjei]|nr:signal peptide peptidase SppA [Desulfomonile tiedjei]